MQVKDVMTPDPVICPASTKVTDAAAMMRDRAIGDVLVADQGRLSGIITDRDLVIRVVAEMRDPSQVTLGEVCTGDLTTVEESCPVDEAVQLMREHSLRRLPVVDNGRPVGIVTLGDLAVDLEPESALGEISNAPPNS